MIITLTGFVPLRRFDGKHWASAQVQEAATADAADADWTTLLTAPLNPLDSDPTAPMSRNFTIDATLDAGWYRVVFIDQDNEEMAPTVPIHNIGEAAAAFLPSLEDVGAKLRTRTVDNGGNELGTFTSQTRPTAEEAIVLIQQASRDLRLKVGTIPEQLYADAKELIALRAAMLIELSYYTEQIQGGTSPYPELKSLYDEALPTLVAASDDLVEDDIGEGSAGMAQFGFPEDKGGLVGWKTVM